MDLRELADNAVKAHLSAGEPVTKAVLSSVEGRGLTTEQVMRVSGLANRQILQRTKEAAAGNIPERFDTSKADEVSRLYKERTTGANTTDDFRQAHTQSARDAALLPAGSGATYKGELETPMIRDSVIGKSPSAAGPATLEEVAHMIRDRSGEPMMAGTGVTPETKLAHDVDMLYAAWGVRKQEHVLPKTSADADPMSRLNGAVLAAHGARRSLGGRSVAADLGAQQTCARLAVEIVRLEKTSGFTLGETLHAVRRGMEGAGTPSVDDAFTSLFKEVVSSAYVDIDAAAGRARDTTGQLKTSAIAAERARLAVRPQVAASALDESSALMKLSRQFAEQFEACVVLRVADARLMDAAERGHRALGDYGADA